MNKLYSIEEVAEVLGLCGHTVRILVKSGDLPHVRIRKQIRVTGEDLHRYIMRNKSYGGEGTGTRTEESKEQ